MIHKLWICIVLLCSLQGAMNSQSYRIHAKAVKAKNWAYFDITGKLIFQPKFYIGHVYSEDGFALLYSTVKKSYSIINRHGLIIHTEIAKFFVKDMMGYSPKGYSDGLIVVREFNKWGCLDTSGRIAIPLRWDNLLDFKQGYGIGIIDDQYYVINKTTGTETQIKQQGIFEMKEFSEDLAPFKIREGLEGYIDSNGETAIKPEFRQVGYFNNGISWAKGINGLVGYINKKGEWIIKPQFTIGLDFEKESGLARVKDGEVWMYVNEAGDRISFDNSDIIEDFHDGLARGKKDLVFGFYNNKGEWVIPPKYEGLRDFKNGFAAARSNDLWGIIDKKGNWIIQPQFEAIKDVVKILDQ